MSEAEGHPIAVLNGDYPSKDGPSGGSNNKLSEKQTDAADKTSQCGLLSWRPAGLQRCNNMYAFTATMSAVGVFGTMNFTYFSAVITQIEKRFGFSSATTGFLKNVDNIGSVLLAIIFAHYCRYGHKPKIMSIATFISSIAIFIFALPHFLYGKGGIDSVAFPNSTNTSYSSSTKLDLCDSYDDQRKQMACKDKVSLEATNNGALAIFIISELLQGCAQAPKMSLGMTFLDDNAGNQSPKYIGFAFGMRIFAPFLGFLMGAWTSSMYVDLSDTDLTPGNPRWVGAWWLGFVICGVCSVIWTLPLLLFPANVPDPIHLAEQENDKEETDKDPDPSGVTQKLTDLPKALWRLMKNKIYMLILLAICCEVFQSGAITFLPKYIETHFQQTASMASIYAGAFSAISFSIGPIVSGKILSKIKITPFKTIRFVVIVNIIYIAGVVGKMFLGCPQTPWDDVPTSSSWMGSNTIEVGTCRGNCSCDPTAFQPVCGINNINYRSPCHAGCTDQTFVDNSTEIMFTGCGCVEGGTATPGACLNHCQKYIIGYVVIMFLANFVAAMPFIAVLMTLMRCVEERDKALAVATIGLVLNIVSFPAPMLFGYIIDGACLIQQFHCGKKGACLLYNQDSFRIRMHGMIIIIKLFALVFHITGMFVSYKMEADEKQKEEELKMMTDEKRPMMYDKTDLIGKRLSTA